MSARVINALTWQDCSLQRARSRSPWTIPNRVGDSLADTGGQEQWAHALREWKVVQWLGVSRTACIPAWRHSEGPG